MPRHPSSRPDPARDTAQSPAAGEDLLARVHAFLDDPAGDDFDALALAAFRRQYEASAPYRRLCESRGATPQTVASWRDVPAVPTTAYKSLDLSVGNPGADDTDVPTFRSSGTTAGSDGDAGDEARSVHRHLHPDLYRHTLDVAFPHFCPLVAARPPILALVPEREAAPDSSLAFMVDHLVTKFGSEASRHAFGRRGADVRAARSWIGARQRDGRPALVLATAFALADLLDGLEKMGLRFRLPPGSAVMVTGGFKGHRREVDEPDLAERLDLYLGVGPEAILGEYGMTELTSQLYTANLRRPDAAATGLFDAPHWVRVRVLDPETLQEAAPGEDGLVAVFDLANLSSAVHVLSEDLGRMETPPGGGSGLRLLGRAPGAELRGCSLLVEELAAGDAAG